MGQKDMSFSAALNKDCRFCAIDERVPGRTLVLVGIMVPTCPPWGREQKKTRLAVRSTDRGP